MTFHIITHTATPSTSIGRLMTALSKQIKVFNYGKSVDKLTQYQFFKDNVIAHPEWSINITDALAWQAKGDVVFVRTKVKGACGSGIMVVEPGQEMPDGKVYTKYMKKKREFRVNLFQHQFVNVREKVRTVSTGTAGYIRNKDNGYHTVKCKTATPDGVAELAIAASAVSDSDFIGVDIGYNEYYNKLFVLEVNSGPSIEGSSVNEYAAQLLKAI